MKNILSILIISLLLTNCSGCSKKRSPNTRGTGKTTGADNIIKMTPKGGVYEIPAEINGVKMNFIFDTGASDITMSEVEALFMVRQGKLSEKDILGKEQYSIADGSISEGTVIVLRSVKIGNKELKNVKASIIHNDQAPLLLGQSALSKFGKLSIDYNRNQLTIE